MSIVGVARAPFGGITEPQVLSILHSKFPVEVEAFTCAYVVKVGYVPPAEWQPMQFALITGSIFAV